MHRCLTKWPSGRKRCLPALLEPPSLTPSPHTETAHRGLQLTVTCLIWSKSNQAISSQTSTQFLMHMHVESSGSSSEEAPSYWPLVIPEGPRYTLPGDRVFKSLKNSRDKAGHLAKWKKTKRWGAAILSFHAMPSSKYHFYFSRGLLLPPRNNWFQNGIS